MQKAVIYTRVSTDDQRDHGFSLQDQEGQLRTYCRQHGYEIIKHYQDDHSAKNFNRPQYEIFLDDLKNKVIKPNVFVCCKIDRFSRNTLQTLLMIENFEKWGIKPIFIDNPIDLNNPDSKMAFVLGAQMAESENMRRSQNTIRGMRQAAREGRCMGSVPKGYKRDPLTKLLYVDEPMAEIVRLVFNLYAEGVYSSEEIRRIGRGKGLTLSKQSFLDLLQNKMYVGIITIKAWHGEPEAEAQGLHLAIIDERLFYKVQNVLKGRRKGYKGLTKSDEVYLVGQLICPDCQRPMTGSASRGHGGLYHYYHCQRKYGCKNSFKATTVNEELIRYLDFIQPRKEVVGLYKAILRDVFLTNESQKEEKRKKLEKEIETVQKRIKALRDYFLDGSIDLASYKEGNSDLKEKESDLIGKHVSVTTLSQDYKRYIDYGCTFAENVSGYFKEASPTVRKKIVSSIFPEKLRWDGKSYRTTKMNEFFALLCNPIEGFKEKQPRKKAKLSSGAPPSRLERETL